MFKNILNVTPLTTEAANDYFESTIYGDTWNSDVTFLTSLRALLAPRLAEGESLNLHILNNAYNRSTFDGASNKSIAEYIVGGNMFSEHTLHVVNFRSAYPEVNTLCMDALETELAASYDGWHRVEKVTAFFHKVFRVLCFINPELRSVFLFTDNMDARRMHYLQCGIFAFLPWYFDPEKGVTEDEMGLIQSLREKSSDKYLEYVGKIAAKYDFQTARIRRLLRGFEMRYEQVQCEAKRSELQSIADNLVRLDRQIAEQLHLKRDAEAALFGLEMKIQEAGETSELMDYFLCHKNLSLESVRGSVMKFITRSTLDYYDEDIARRVINNDSSFLYNYCGDPRTGQITREDMKLLMTEIFLKNTLRVRFCAGYQLKLEGGVSALGGIDYGPQCADYLPNPHIDRYKCLGNYTRLLNARMQSHDYIGAIEQCIASGKSLNFGDSPVMNTFADSFYTNTRAKFIEDMDGHCMTVCEAVQWIKDRQNKEDAE